MSTYRESRCRLLVLAAGLAGFLHGCASPAEEAGALPPPLVAVKVAPAELLDVTVTLEAPAEIHPRSVAQIASRITAPIRSIDVGKGDRVAEGQIVATLENRDLLAQIADAEAGLRQAQGNFERRDDLFREGAIPERDFLASQTDLEKARAQVELVRAQLEFTELKSPFAAVVTDQYLYPGDMAKPDAPLITVMDVSLVIARAQVPEAEAATVRAGQRAVFLSADPVGAAPEGRIRVVSAAVDPARRTVEVWCELANRDGRLHPGVFGSLRIDTATLPASVVVPLAAVELAEGSRRGSVLVVGDDHVAHRREVECGESFDGLVRVERGLESGEVVVVEGGYGLADGTPVTFEASGAP